MKKTLHLFVLIASLIFIGCQRDSRTISSSSIMPLKIQGNTSNGESYFGKKVYFSGDYILISTEDSSDIGSVYLYKKTANDNVVLIAKIQDTEATPYDYFGDAISMYGNYIVIGSYRDSTAAVDSGSVFIYKFQDNGNVTRIAKIQSNDAQTYEFFGTSVSIYGDYIAVGSSNTSIVEEGEGCFYLYKLVNDNVEQIAKISAPDSSVNDRFGTNIYIYENYIAVGSSPYSAVRIHLYEIVDDSNISHIAKIQPDDINTSNAFGDSISIYGDYIAIGASGKTIGPSEVTGRTYIYKVDVNNVIQIARLQADEPMVDNHFGNAVSMYGDYIAVGAYTDDSATLNSGTVYLFKKESDNNVSQVAKIEAFDADISDLFGSSVGISGNYLAVGAKWEGESWSDYTGCVYVYRLDQLE